MPIIFIHGVSVRQSNPGFADGVAARDEMLRRLVVEPLGAQDARLRAMQIVNPYWGDLGVKFGWQLASLPSAAGSEALGQLEAAGAEADAVDAQEADLVTAETVAAIANAPVPVPAGNGHGEFAAEDALDPAVGPIQRAARRDLVRLTESLLTPLLLAETRLDAADEAAPSSGQLQAEVAIAAYAAATDASVETQVQQAQSDEEVIEVLTRAVQARLADQVRTSMAAEREAVGEEDGAEGGAEFALPGWLDGVQNQVEGLFGRILAGPAQAIVSSIIEGRREPIHRNLARFVGDVCVYLIRRGEIAAPGPIITKMVDAIRNTPKGHPDEPVIVITHSMGGNILYDLVTHYAPDVEIDVWISVGGQVAQFEEMKLFRTSDPQVGAPQKVAKPGVGYWLNVYDPADVLSFRVRPVFANVDGDEAFETGASVFKAHGEYFGRASFYGLVRQHITQAMQAV